MDFGVVGFDGFLCSPSPTTTNNGGGFSLTNAATAAAAEVGSNSNKQKWGGGFGFLKQERAMNEEESRDFKLAKTTSSSSNNNGGENNNNNNNIPLLQRSNINGSSSNNNIHSHESHHHQQMLSFSSPNSHTTTSFPYYHHHQRSAGMNNGGGIAAMQGGVLSGVRGPFTPSQWMELEHQALIYKYITANVPIPSYLLNPITKAFESAGFSPFSGLRSNALGWGSAFHLGFSNSDPEPGRCRRTDGKKWRCSRDAVADQKYCERHMNRGRHRSRKPVEAQPGTSAPSVTTTTSTAAKLTSASVGGGGGVLPHHHISGLAPNNINNSRNAVTASYPKLSLKDNNNSNNSYEETTPLSEFGLVCSDSLLNPLNRSSSLINGGAAASPDNLNGHDQTTKSSHHPLIRQFMDDSWPKTQLSISIPTDELKSSPPPQRLSGDLEMGLGVGPPNWVPISWGPSMGGPLGEVLHNSASTSECKNTTTTTAGAGATKPLNLIDSWDNSPRLASSPTGVLQRGSFVSLSNSSGGSSPRGGGGESSRILDGPGLFNGLFSGPVLTNPSL